MTQRINPSVIKNYFEGHSVAEGARNLLAFVMEGIKSKKFTADNFSYRDLGLAIGALDPYDMSGSFARVCAESKSTELFKPEHILTESNPGIASNAFQIITSELLASKVIEGYTADDGSYIGDQLVTTMTGQRVRNQRIAGMTSLGGPEAVSEGHPYGETSFDEKYVTTSESKKGRIVSINEELLIFDQTGEINRRAYTIGELTRQERERTIVRGVIDADSNVYRPSGSATALYATSGANKNYIGSGGVSGFNSAVALQDWTDIDTVLTYRATKVTDDRIDGTARPILGLRGRQNMLLVPEAKRMTAMYIAGTTQLQKNTNSAVDETRFNNIVANEIGGVLSSPFVDEVNSDNWFYGNFKKQFIWTEIYPIQTFTQSMASEAGFERDVALRVKVRYYGGISAVDTVYVTMVDGA